MNADPTVLLTDLLQAAHDSRTDDAYDLIYELRASIETLGLPDMTKAWAGVKFDSPADETA